MVVWAIQENLNSSRQPQIDALHSIGAKWELVSIIPFQGIVDDIDTDDIVLPLGTTTMLKDASRKGWKIFYDEKTFNPRNYAAKYGDQYLNHDTRILQLKDVESMPEEEVFVRPNTDMKEFSGGVYRKDYLVQLAKDAVEGKMPFDGSLELAIASPKNVEEEWRFVVVNGKVITGSKYRRNGLLAQSTYVPKEIEEFCQLAVDIYSPDAVFVIDIGTESGTPKVIECNCFNGSGLYECDREKAYKAIEEFLKRPPLSAESEEMLLQGIEDAKAGRLHKLEGFLDDVELED